MQYAEALKNFRRGMHLYNAEWRAATICANRELFLAAMTEAETTFRAAGVFKLFDLQRKIITTTKDATMRFHLVTGALDAYEMAGLQFTQMIFVGYESPLHEQHFIRGLLRSPVVPEKHLLYQESVVL